MKESEVEKLLGAIRNMVEKTGMSKRLTLLLVVSDDEERMSTLAQFGKAGIPMEPLANVMNSDEGDAVFTSISVLLDESKVDSYIDILQSIKQSFIDLRSPRPCVQCSHYTEMGHHFGRCDNTGKVIDGEEIRECDKFTENEKEDTD